MGAVVVDYKAAGGARQLSPGDATSTSRNLTVRDIGKVIPVDTSAGAVVLTLTAGVMAPCDVIYVRRSGGNTVTFAGSGATVNNPDAVACNNGGVMALLADPTALNVAVVI